MRACNLHDICSQNALYGKVNGAQFWREDFTYFIKGMADRGLLYRMELPSNQVWYAITKKGNLAYLKQCEPKKFQLLCNIRVDRAFKRVLRYNEEDDVLELIATAADVPAEVLSRLIVVRMGKMHGRLDFEISKYPTNHSYQERDKNKLVAVYEALKKFLGPELEAETTKLMKEEAIKVFKQEHERELHYRATIVTKVLGNCMFCGAQIHNEDAAKDAELLKKFAGTKTGLICCGCFSHLQWVDKFLVMGGETVCKEQC